MTQSEKLTSLSEENPTEINPIALIKGQAIVELPKDLYIRPDAMKVLLETFEGPLDFLLYLIRKQNLNILDIPIADVTRQYMEYIDVMQHLSLELAGEYLVMAAILAEIKSRMLLPAPSEGDNQEDDPRAELVRRLQEYERYKQAGQDIERLPRLERDIFMLSTATDLITVPKPLPQISLQDLSYALVEVLKRLELSAHHQIHLEHLSIHEKMTLILTVLEDKKHLLFSSLFNLQEGRNGIVVTFLAMLELLKQHLIRFVQAAPFGPIYLHLDSQDIDYTIFFENQSPV